MRYTVLPTKALEDDLADIWLRATDRKEVTEAFNRIERLLKVNAHSRGQSVPGGRRVLSVPPLSVVFAVDSGDCKVTMLQVFRTD